MFKNSGAIGKKRGVAILLAIFFMILLSLIAIALIGMVPVELQSSTRTKLDLQAHYAVTSGIRHARSWCSAVMTPSTDPNSPEYLGDSSATTGNTYYTSGAGYLNDITGVNGTVATVEYTPMQLKDVWSSGLIPTSTSNWNSSSKFGTQAGVWAMLNIPKTGNNAVDENTIVLVKKTPLVMGLWSTYSIIIPDADTPGGKNTLTGSTVTTFFGGSGKAGRRCYQIVSLAYYQGFPTLRAKSTILEDSFARYSLFVDSDPNKEWYLQALKGQVTTLGPVHTNGNFHFAIDPALWGASSTDAVPFNGLLTFGKYATAADGLDTAHPGDGNLYSQGNDIAGSQETHRPFDLTSGSSADRYGKMLAGGQSNLRKTSTVSLPPDSTKISNAAYGTGFDTTPYSNSTVAAHVSSGTAPDGIFVFPNGSNKAAGGVVVKGDQEKMFLEVVDANGKPMGVNNTSQLTALEDGTAVGNPAIRVQSKQTQTAVSTTTATVTTTATIPGTTTSSPTGTSTGTTVGSVTTLSGTTTGTTTRTTIRTTTLSGTTSGTTVQTTLRTTTLSGTVTTTITNTNYNTTTLSGTTTLTTTRTTTNTTIRYGTATTTNYTTQTSSSPVVVTTGYTTLGVAAAGVYPLTSTSYSLSYVTLSNTGITSSSTGQTVGTTLNSGTTRVSSSTGTTVGTTIRTTVQTNSSSTGTTVGTTLNTVTTTRSSSTGTTVNTTFNTVTTTRSFSTGTTRGTSYGTTILYGTSIVPSSTTLGTVLSTGEITETFKPIDQVIEAKNTSVTLNPTMFAANGTSNYQLPAGAVTNASAVVPSPAEMDVTKLAGITQMLIASGTNLTPLTSASAIGTDNVVVIKQSRTDPKTVVVFVIPATRNSEGALLNGAVYTEGDLGIRGSETPAVAGQGGLAGVNYGRKTIGGQIQSSDTTTVDPTDLFQQLPHKASASLGVVNSLWQFGTKRNETDSSKLKAENGLGLVAEDIRITASPNDFTNFNDAHSPLYDSDSMLNIHAVILAGSSSGEGGLTVNGFKDRNALTPGNLGSTTGQTPLVRFVGGLIVKNYYSRVNGFTGAGWNSKNIYNQQLALKPPPYFPNNGLLIPLSYVEERIWADQNL